jgi:hypothetical protein
VIRRGTRTTARPPVHHFSLTHPRTAGSPLSIPPSHGLHPFSIHSGLPSRCCVLDRTSG